MQERHSPVRNSLEGGSPTIRIAPVLAGRRVLLVEDEYFIADDFRRSLEADGAEVLGPVASVEDALDLLAQGGRVDGAVLDINLRGETVYPVADALLERGVPFLFATGYDRASIPARFAAIAHCQKPVAPEAVGRILCG